MASFRERLNAALTRWKDSGKSETEVFKAEYDQVRAYLWAFSTGAKKEGVSEDVIEFSRLNLKVLGNQNYNSMLRKRKYCNGCAETYKLENLRICVECDNLYCYRCVAYCDAAANGNSSCSCGGELVG